MRKKEVKEVIDKNSRTYWQNLINEWVHNKTDRTILTRFLLDGVTLEIIAEELDMDYKGLYVRYRKAVRQLIKHTEI